MRELAVDGRRRLAVPKGWDGDLTALGLVLDPDLGKAFEAPINVILSRGEWRSGSGVSIKVRGKVERWRGWPEL